MTSLSSGSPAAVRVKSAAATTPVMAEKSAIHATIEAHNRRQEMETFPLPLQQSLNVAIAEAGVDGHLRGRDGIMFCA